MYIILLSWIWNNAKYISWNFLGIFWKFTEMWDVDQVLPGWGHRGESSCKIMCTAQHVAFWTLLLQARTALAYQKAGKLPDYLNNFHVILKQFNYIIAMKIVIVVIVIWILSIFFTYHIRECRSLCSEKLSQKTSFRKARGGRLICVIKLF